MKTINGLQNFTDYFAPFKESYLIIGGTACYLLMEETGLEFRSTKDLDIILLSENTTKDFVKSFWTYIRKGKYKIWESKGEPRFFRFSFPTSSNYPPLIELFSKDDHFGKGRYMSVLDETGTEIPSLSAIVMDTMYYDFALSHKEFHGNAPCLNKIGLIVLKIRAFNDLFRKKENGEITGQHQISKHRNDVFRLLYTMTGEERENVPETMKNDIRLFFSRCGTDDTFLRQIGIRSSLKELAQMAYDVFLLS